MGGEISIFDRMLAENRRQMDELFEDVADSTGKDTGTGSADSDAPAEAKPVAGSRPVRRPHEVAITQETAKALTSRLGSDWHYEILSQEHDGDQLVVSCKLIADGKGTSTTGKGSAQLRQSAAAGTPVAGRVDGVPFKTIADGKSAQEPPETARQSALQQAVGEALMKCLETI